MSQNCPYCGIYNCMSPGPRICCQAGRDYDALSTELAETKVQLADMEHERDIASHYIGTVTVERDALATQLAEAVAALKPLADIPLEEFNPKRDDQPLMGWNDHTLYVRDVFRARAARTAVSAPAGLVPKCSVCDQPIGWLANGDTARCRCDDSAPAVQLKLCGTCTTQSWCETHGCRYYPDSADGAT